MLRAVSGCLSLWAVVACGRAEPLDEAAEDALHYLHGPDYLLAERSLARALAELCSADVQLRPARITRRSTGETFTSHDELVVARELTAEEVGAGSFPPGRAWRSNSYLMVAPDVRQGLIERGFTQLVFTRGLEGFVG